MAVAVSLCRRPFRPPQRNISDGRRRQPSASCRAGSSDPGEEGGGGGGEKKKKGRRALTEIYAEVAKMGKGLQENLSPKQKGDWKDVLLMSLSFSVYVYISQKLVCAYCMWRSML